MIYNYITTNHLNGKQYIGMHYTDDIDDGYLGSGVAILAAIKKYGKENFTREILGFCPDVSTAHYNEGIYIAKFNTLTPNGYNISPKGGLGCPGDIVSEETKLKIGKSRKGKLHSKEARKKISVANKGKMSSMKGNHHSKETKEKMRNSQKGRLSPMKGKHHSKETKDKISIAMKERDKSINIRISNSLKGIKRPPRTEEQRQHYRDAALRRFYG